MKTFRLFSIAALALAMAACSSEENTLETQSPAAPGKLHFTATIEAPRTGATTRTEYTEITSGDDAGKINVKWEVGDKIALVHNGVVDEAKVKTVDDVTGKATIEADITGSPSDNDDVYLAYPADAVADAASYSSLPFTPNTTTFDKVKSQDGTLEYIQNNLDFRMGSGKLAVSGDKATLKESVSIPSLICIWKLTLQDDAATPNALNATKLTFKNETFTQAEATSTGKSEYYLCVVPSFIPDASGTFSFEATVGSDTYTFSKMGFSLTAGKYYPSTVTMAKAPVDLSMVDNAGNAREKQWTANCYMVHTAGDYKLPLVYGNAIKDGAPNTAAYTGIETANTTLTFPNHAGNAINAPWITKATTGTGADKGMGIVVSTAELLWQDAEGLITAVGIIGDYLTLTVGKNASEQEGNALIAAKDADGNIVWSWHIWVTTETFAADDLTTVTTGTGTLGTDYQVYKVTPVNLGWVPTGGDGKKGYAPYYQWGRKDPFKGTGAPADLTVYDINGTAIAGMTYGTSTTATIADNIKNPTTYYYTPTSGPCITTYYNMWDAQQKADGNIKTATKKTVYDPCPAGFCVPTGNLYYFMGNGDRSMGTGKWDDANKGATWDISTTGNNLFFPASGLRVSDISGSGSLKNVGTHGGSWSASANSNNSHRIYFNSANWSWNSSSRATGFPVRAVAEE